MRSDPSAVLQSERSTDLTPLAVCAAAKRRGGSVVLLDGAGGPDAWAVAPLLGVAPRTLLRCGADDAAEGLARVARRVAERRGNGPPETGVVALLGYDLFDARTPSDGLPRLVAAEVDSSLRWVDGRCVRLTARDAAGLRQAGDLLEAAHGHTTGAISPRPGSNGAGEGSHASPTRHGPPRTSLPRAAYLRAVETVRRHILAGDVYQANLCQQFRVAWRGDPLAVHAALCERTPAPRSAFLAAPGLAVASASPETFLRVDAAGQVETLPIKGTRPRSADPRADAAAAAELLRSPKDGAELLMIVDLERNDLSRVCRPGTIEVPELVRLRSYPAVHHLVARVTGRLADGMGPLELLRATFPGGSITGAPKRRAMELLATLEPVPRNLFTGSLVWFGDDGTLDSSLLIRTAVFDERRVYVGAGGGVVADSDPEGEWLESNHKARALTRVLGFDPEEAC